LKKTQQCPSWAENDVVKNNIGQSLNQTSRRIHRDTERAFKRLGGYNSPTLHRVTNPLQFV